MSDKTLALAVCPVCGQFNSEVTMELNAPTQWLDCGHTVPDLMALVDPLAAVRRIAFEHLGGE